MDTAAVAELERKLEELEEGTGGGRRRSRRASREAVPTGVEALDRVLPGGGLPRGKGTEWLGPRSCGKTALLRAALARLRTGGESMAVVDAERTLYAPDWELPDGGGRFWVVRPPSAPEAPWCVDLLLRSGAFGTVALLSESGLGRSVSVRLQRLAEEAGSVFVASGELPIASLRLRFRPGRLEPVTGSPFGPFLPSTRPLWVRVARGGRAEVPILCPEPPRRVRPRRSRDRKGRR